MSAARLGVLEHGIRQQLENPLAAWSTREEGNEMSMAIHTSGLARSFGELDAVQGVDLAIPRGSVTAFLGRNGAGKSTTIRMLMGLVRPTRGRATVLGFDPTRQGAELRSRVGYMPERPAYPPWMSVQQLLDYLQPLYSTWNPSVASELLDQLELDPRKKISTLSRGNLAKVALLLALVHEPELLILDDPIAGLDPIVRRELFETLLRSLADAGRSIFFSSHLIPEVERIATHVVLLEQGKVLEQAPLEELQQKAHAFRCRLELPAEGIEGLWTVKASGNMVEVVLQGEAFAAEQALKSAGATHIQRLPLDLEGLFVARVLARKEGRA